MRMLKVITPVFGLLLMAAMPAVAEDGRQAALDALLADRDGNISRLARNLLGEQGGDALFYLPTRDQPQTPARWNFRYEDVRFESADATPLHGWFLPARAAKPLGTVVFSHGNSGSVGHHLGFVMWMVEAGYHVFMYDYRGFGKSGGRVDRRGMIEDVQAAFRHVASRGDIDPKRIISFGHSMGGAKSVTALAEARPAGLRAVVVDGTFASYQTMARVFAGQLGANVATDAWSPIAHVNDLAPVPLLVVHGTDDEVVPFEQGRLLYERAAQPKSLFRVEDGRHGDSLARRGGEYRAKVLEWLANALAD